MPDLFDFWDSGSDAVDASPEVGYTPQDVPAPTEAPAPVAVPQGFGDPVLRTYSTQVDSLYSRFGVAPPGEAAFQRNLADTSTPSTDVKGAGPKTADDGGSIFKSIAKFMGFSDTPEGRNASASFVAGATGALIKGGVEGLIGGQVRRATAEKMAAETELASAQAESVRRKTSQAGLDSLTLSQAPGLIGGFKPAPFVPVKQRTV